MTVHILRDEQRYIGQRVALCGQVVTHHDEQLARGLRANCAACLARDREDDKAIQSLQEMTR